MMSSIIVLLLPLLLSGVSAQSQVSLSRSSTGAALGSIAVQGLSLNPCNDNSLQLPSSVQNGLTGATAINDVIMTIQYRHLPKSSSEVIGTQGISKTITLMNGNNAASPARQVLFRQTVGSEQVSATVDFGTVNVFNAILLAAPTDDASCSAAALSATGITGHATLDMDFVITIGPVGTGGLSTNEGEALVAYDASAKGLANGFTDLSWALKSQYSFGTDGIDWTPCEYKGIAFFNIVSKYRAAHVRSIEIRMTLERNTLLGVWLHNTGEDKSKFETHLEFDTASNGKIVSIPVDIADENVLFDQIRITETAGTLCSTDNLASLHISYVGVRGDSSLLSSSRRSNNGVIVPDNGSSDPDSQESTSAAEKLTSAMVVALSVVFVAVL